MRNLGHVNCIPYYILYLLSFTQSIHSCSMNSGGKNALSTHYYIVPFVNTVRFTQLCDFWNTLYTVVRHPETICFVFLWQIALYNIYIYMRQCFLLKMWKGNSHIYDNKIANTQNENQLCMNFSYQNIQLENKRRQFWFCCHMLSCNCQAGPLFGVVDAGLHYDTNIDQPDNIW